MTRSTRRKAVATIFCAACACSASTWACTSDTSDSGVGASTAAAGAADAADGPLLRVKKINTYGVKSYGVMRQVLASAGVMAK